jgi:ubiquinone biosynthesis O-methyltransferase
MRPPKAMEIEFNKYESRGEDYHWAQASTNPLRMSAFVRGRYEKCVQLLESRLGRLTNKSVLDFGCGDGAFSNELTRAGASVSGIDSSEAAIASARKRHGILGTKAEFFCESCYETHFPDCSFDGLVSTDVIEHVQHPERFLQEIMRVLKPGGVAVISTPIRLTEQPLDILHVAEWFPSEFQRVIGAHFHDAEFFVSHPTVWHEIEQRSKVLRTLVNLVSLFGNPYLRIRKWHIFSQQYAICTKPATGKRTE